MPDIVNYGHVQYGGGTHNWDIEQDRNGILYFANDEGVLTFDGSYWKIYQLPNKTIVRSIEIGNDHKLYAGGQGEFGYFSPNEQGQLIFKSLKEKVPEKYRSFADIWNIESVGKAIYFRTENHIFQWHNDTIDVFSSPSEWLFMGKVDHHLIAQDKSKGLLKLTGKTWTPVVQNPLPEHFVINSVTQLAEHRLLVSSSSHGLYHLDHNKLHHVSSSSSIKHVTHIRQVDPHMHVVATLNNGCFLTDQHGKPLNHISKNNGLQNNTVLSTHIDNNGNIWLGLADGISFIAHNNGLKHINPDIFDNASGHTSAIFDNSLYVGLASGVFRLPIVTDSDISMAQTHFTPLGSVWGQAWGMNVVQGKLLLGRHEGVVEINGNHTVPIADGKGYWNFLNWSSNSGDNNLVLAGNYYGISIFQHQNGQFRPKGSIPNFHESARFIETDKQNIWVSHPYKGIYKIVPTADMHTRETKLYTHQEGLPSTYNNHIYSIKGRIVAGTEKGIYEYDATTDSFVLSSFFQPIFDKKYIRYLKEDTQSNIWFIEEKKLGVALYNGNSYTLLYIPELDGKTLGGFEHIHCIDKNNILVGSQKGFYHLNLEKYLTKPRKQHAHISLVKAFGKVDSVLFGGYFGEVNADNKQGEPLRIKHGLNSFHFEFSSTSNKNNEHVYFSCYLKGFEDDWSTPDKKTERVYTNLPAGGYVFMVKTQDNLGNESEIAAYHFTILPPWYESIWAYMVYILLFIGLCYLLYKRHRRKLMEERINFQKEQEHIKYMHQLEMDKSEKEIIKLKNEKLEIEIETKNSELASNAMHLVQKAELMSNIKSELFKLKKELKDDMQVTDFNRIIRLLDTEEKSDASWEQFSVHFDAVHVNFLKRLQETYPRITNTELRLSAYLKMNLSTKEIASLMKISPRGVEVGRYRLRKKLNLPSHTNLFEFFSGL